MAEVGLMQDCYLREIKHPKGNSSNDSLAQNKIFFSSIPKGLNFQRTAQYKETPNMAWTEPMLVFGGTNALELNLELDYVAGVHFDTVDELKTYAKMWQALPLSTLPSTGVGINDLRAPNAVKLVISDLVSTRGIIKNVNVSFSEDYTWESSSKKVWEGVNPTPIAFKVNFTFMESHTYTTRNASGTSAKSGRIKNQKHRADVLKNFYNHL